MIPLTKFLDPQDYHDLTLFRAVKDLMGYRTVLELDFLMTTPVCHEHRWWEWGLACVAATQAQSWGRVLEITHGPSMITPALVADVPRPEAYLWDAHGPDLDANHARCRGYATSLQGLPVDITFDFIACVSVLEHVRNGHLMAVHLRDLLALGGVLFLTVDAAALEPDIYQFHDMRANIYTPASWKLVSDMLCHHEAGGRQYELVGGSDFTWRGRQVHDYSFASLALRRAA